MARPSKRSLITENDPRYTAASIDPLTLRYLALVLKERGCDTRPLCRGLGFDIADLSRPDFRISYRQASRMIRRAQEMLAEPGLGLAVGLRQTPVSWGLVGFGMLSQASLRDAAVFGLRYQKDAGSLANITVENGKTHVSLIADLIFFDPEIEVFLIEEMFSSMCAISRFLVGPQFVPAAVELVYKAPPRSGWYQSLFRCPVHFGKPRNRLLVDVRWMDQALVTHDALVAQTVEDLIERSLRARREKADFGATIERAIRENLKSLPPLAQIAAGVHMSERTLRRKLAEAGFSYQGLVESVRKARALELLSYSRYSVADVAAETGFADVRNFRKAFKRDRESG
jgi:AraC-like DNA-binding protein